MFKTFTLAITALFLCANPAHAADDCAKQAADKKLAGAAKSSYMKKCSADGGPATAATAASAPSPLSAPAAPLASAACDKQAAEKKLAGAAKTSFMKKCSAEAK